MCVTLANMPGALFKAISCFALRCDYSNGRFCADMASSDINVCKIESRPKSQSAWAESRASAYAVYIDIDCSHNAIAMEVWPLFCLVIANGIPRMQWQT